MKSFIENKEHGRERECVCGAERERGRDQFSLELDDISFSWVQYICLIGCRLPPLDGHVAVCLVLTIDVYDLSN